jgi:hypothetical protein
MTRQTPLGTRRQTDCGEEADEKRRTSTANLSRMRAWALLAESGRHFRVIQE